MKEALQEKIIKSEASISEIAALLEKEFSSDGVINFFNGKGVELTTDDDGEFLSLMQGARDSAASTKLSDDDLAGVAGGVEQGLGGDADIIDTARDLSLVLTPNLGYYIFMI